MYEKLLPYWREACQMALAKNDFTEAFHFAIALGKLGIYHPRNKLIPDDCPKAGEFVWVERADKRVDCLVCGVMLFTWEQGIAE